MHLNLFYDYDFGKRAHLLIVVLPTKVLPRFRFEYTPYGPGWYTRVILNEEMNYIRPLLAMEMGRFILLGE